MFKSILFAVALLGATTANAAVKMIGEHTLQITGNTTQTQAQQVMFSLQKHDVKRVVMWGNGGDYFAGNMIGTMLKEEGVVVQIPTNRRCISACAFAALAGNKVLLGGELWFHRPYRPMYLPDESLTEIEGSAQSAGMHQAYYAYIMDFPIRFVHEMINTTSTCKYIVIWKTSAINKLLSYSFDERSWSVSRRNVDECNANPIRKFIK